jgi:hypothetical protein
MAHATGTDYPALLAERVLRPLALTATTASPGSAALSTRHDRTCRLVTCAYELLHELSAAPVAASWV